jgi:transposase
MQNEVKFYLGMDVSKLWLDLALLPVIEHKKQPVVTERFDNTAAGMKKLHQWLTKKGVTFDANSLLVIENTGIYHRRVWQYCSSINLPIYIGNATHIKRSFGIARGKNDVIDSQRLCDYAYKHCDDLKASPVLDPVFMQLKDLMTARSRLIKQITGTKVYLGELTLSNSKEVQQVMKKAHKAAIDGLHKSLQLIEQQIRKIIKESEAISKNYELLKTVPGIGNITALYMICCTNNFSGKRTGKQLACYAGVVPFTNTSGTSIKGKSHVHPMANKDLKKLLHMGALVCIRYCPELSTYYERKKAEGKHSLSILNAIRNKIVLRAAAVVNNQRPYVNNYKKTG